MGKEAYDDYKRNLRDREANSQKYLALVPSSDSGPHTCSVPSSSLKVGDLVLLEKNQRVPADMVLLRTSDASGTCFIRTDQLDGETDWKLRVAVPATQKLHDDRELLALDAEVYGACSLILYLL
jgi:phospholipid-translocating ATPase